MKVALLSAGPSLKASYGPVDPKQHKIKIGVNTAVQLFKCDWWACADSHRWIDIHKAGVIGKPRVFSIDQERDKVQCFEPAIFAKYKATGWGEVFEGVGASLTWANNTAPAALILALWLGATEVDCYGVDMTGHLDATGVVDEVTTKHRNESRWAQERAMWTLIVDWLAQRGTKVTRHGFQP